MGSAFTATWGPPPDIGPKGSRQKTFLSPTHWNNTKAYTRTANRAGHVNKTPLPVENRLVCFLRLLLLEVKGKTPDCCLVDKQ